MTFSYDPSTDVGRVRRTLPDKDATKYFWTDEELQSFLDDEDGWRRATALALETMAADAAMVLQVIQVQDLHTDGAATARVLLNRANGLRAQANDAEAASGGAFDIISIVYDDFSYREQIYNEALRET